MLKANYSLVGNLLKSAGERSVVANQNSFEVIEKGKDDFVTNIDRELDNWLSTQIHQLFPEDTIISEENNESFQKWTTAKLSYWLIDPIDGTEDFINHKASYAVMAGLLQNQQPQLGFIYAPMRQCLYAGGAMSGGFTINNQPHRPSETDADSRRDCLIILSNKDQRNYGAAILQAVPHAKFYSLGSFGLKVLEVVMGKAQAYIYLNRRVKLWDTVAPLAIALQEKIICSDLQGTAIQFNPDGVDPATLTHHQEMFISTPQFNDRYREKIYHALKKCGYYD